MARVVGVTEGVYFMAEIIEGNKVIVPTHLLVTKVIKFLKCIIQGWAR